MSGKGFVTIGFLSMVVAIGVLQASESVAADENRVAGSERIGHGGSAYAVNQPDAVRKGDCSMASEEQTKADIIERIGHGGSTYSSSQAKSAQAGDCPMAGKRIDVVERLGHGGSTYSSSQTMNN